MTMPLPRRRFLTGSLALSGAAVLGLGGGVLAVPGAAQAAVAAPAALPPIGGMLAVGGPQIAPSLMPQMVRVRRDLTPGSLIVLSDKYYLYYITAPGEAIRYGVAVGRAELVFRGTAEIARKVEWPSWRPTPEMIARNPAAYARHADGMPGGPTNPLGARALYFYQNGRDTAIRIHGTTEPMSIGRSVSNGCIRMVNEHVMDLYRRVPIGTVVTVY